MKKILAMTLTCALSAALLAGCGVNAADGGAIPSNTPAPPSPTQSVGSPSPSPTGEAAGVKTGLAVLAGVSGADAGEKDGKIASEFLVAAVTVAEDGTILRCRLDLLEATMGVNAQGGLTGDAAAPLSTKTELGDGYGMKGASSIGKEWYEQVRAFEDWAVGKTAGELTGSVGEDGKTTDADLVSGCTVAVSDYVKAVVAAMDNARALGAGQDDRLGLAVSGSFSAAKDAGVESDGGLTAAAGISVVTVDAQGSVTSALADTVEAVSSFTAEGKVSVPTEVVGKYELGDSYGMKGASSIGREWYEQMDALTGYMAGKNAGEIAALPGENGKAADADLVAGCTIRVSEQVELTLKAMENAR